MKLPFISRKEHDRLMNEHWEQCRETLIIRHRLWDRTNHVQEKRIKELERALQERS